MLLQINLLVVFLGLWNGMLLLPVLLSWIGPPPYYSAVLNELKESEDSAVTEKHELKSSNSAHQNIAYETAGEDNLTVNYHRHPSVYNDSVNPYINHDNQAVNSMTNVQYNNQPSKGKVLRRVELIWDPWRQQYDMNNQGSNPTSQGL